VDSCGQDSSEGEEEGVGCGGGVYDHGGLPGLETDRGAVFSCIILFLFCMIRWAGRLPRWLLCESMWVGLGPFHFFFLSYLAWTFYCTDLPSWAADGQGRFFRDIYLAIYYEGIASYPSLLISF
jgi:hypothetical protein